MDVVDIEKFFIDQLKNDPRFADLDTSPQSNFHDLVIKPNLLLGQAVFDFVTNVRIGSSLNYFKYQSEAQLDALAANYFVHRRGARSTFVEYTILFENTSNANMALQVSPTDTFLTSDGIDFNTTQEYYFVPSALPLEVIDGNTYRVARFPLMSNSAGRKILIREITSSPLRHPAIVTSTNLSDSSDPVLEETNEQLRVRMIRGLATRNLVSNASVSTVLTETFSNITDTYSVGYGDPEMQRDIAIAGKCWSYHAGGMIDSFVRTPLKPITFQVTGRKMDNQNVYRLYIKRYKGYDVSGSDKSNPHPSLLYGWELINLKPASNQPANADPFYAYEDALGVDPYMTGATILPELPLLFIDRSRELTGTSTTNSEDVLTWDDFELTSTHTPRIEIKSIEEINVDFRFSIYEQLVVDLYYKKSIGEFVNFTIPYWTIDSLEMVQQFVSNESTRFQCANTIVRSFIPVEITNLTIVYDKKYSIDAKLISDTLTGYINAWIIPEPIRLSILLSSMNVPVRLSESGRDFALPSTDRVDQTYNLPPSYFEHYSGPTFVETKQHNIDGSVIHSYSTREIALTENHTLSASKRTVRYFIEPSRIKFIAAIW